MKSYTFGLQCMYIYTQYHILGMFIFMFKMKQKQHLSQCPTDRRDVNLCYPGWFIWDTISMSPPLRVWLDFPLPQIYMRFLEYEMHNSNECKRNFVAIYDGSSSVEHLKNKFCSTVANDVMLVSSVGVVRLWADEGSRKSKFKILFTTFHQREWICVTVPVAFIQS